LKPRVGLLPGDALENTAAIYFDFNSPVITEPSALVAEFSTGVVEQGSTPGLFPNPASDFLNIRWGVPANGSYTWTILSSDGRILQGGTRAKGDTTFDIHQLSDGFYLLRIDQGANIFTMPFTRTGQR